VSLIPEKLRFKGLERQSNQRFDCFLMLLRFRNKAKIWPKKGQFGRISGHYLSEYFQRT